MTTEYRCPSCGNDEFTLLRKHTVWETVRVDHIQPDGCYEENDSDFGETECIGEIEDITCSHCESTAPASNPLWPTKENN